jgi:hypothetical protein
MLTQYLLKCWNAVRDCAFMLIPVRYGSVARELLYKPNEAIRHACRIVIHLRLLVYYTQYGPDKVALV